MSPRSTLAGSRAVQAGRGLQQRRLAGAGRPHDRGERAALEVERHVVERADRAVAGAEVANQGVELESESCHPRSQPDARLSLGRSGDLRFGIATPTSGKPPEPKGDWPFKLCGMARTVLVVDDSAAFRRTARMLLQARGYEVVGAAEDIASALATAAELQPDCVLLDVNLPDGDGRDDGGAASTVRWSCSSPRSTRPRSATSRLSGARGFVPKAELASPRLVELLGPP